MGQTNMRRTWRHTLAVLGGLLLALALPIWGIADAQLQLPDAARELQNGTAGAQQPIDNGPVPSVQIYQPIIPDRAVQSPPSELERLYGQRSGRVMNQVDRAQNRVGGEQNQFALTQFGYDVVGIPSAVTAAQVGGVQDNYVLGDGDELLVDLRGQQNATYRVRVNRDGQVLIPRLNPIPVAGRTFGQFRAALEQQVAQTYAATSVFASVGQIRQVSVLVTGEVRKPGVRILSGLATPLDALLLSGGISKTGSLRDVRLIRGNQVVPLDLYSLLMQGTLPDIGGLRSGDRIFVPPLGSTVAILGVVQRPGIYELSPGQNSITTDALIGLAGGYEIAGNYRLSKTQLEPDGAIRLISLSSNEPIANGEILFVDSERDQRIETVELRGAVKLPNKYPLSTVSTLHKLIRGIADLLPDAYTPFIILLHRDPVLNTQTVESISLPRILSGQQEVPLLNDDVIYVFNRDEMRSLRAYASSRQVGTTNNTTAAAPAANGAGELGGGTGAGTGFDTRLQAAGLQTTMGQNISGQNVQGQNNQGQFNPGQSNPIQSGPNPYGPNPYGPNQYGPNQNGPNQNGPNPQSNPGNLQVVPQFNSLPTNATVALAQAAAAANQQSGAVANVPYIPVAQIAENIGIPEPVLTSTLNEHTVWLLDQVKDPGPYFAGPGSTLRDLLQVAGGPLLQADLSSVEVTSTKVDGATGTSNTVRTNYKGSVTDFDRVTLESLDVIRFRPVFSDRELGRITITGEVRYPGSFDIRRGERLSSVIARAGGLTDEAYALGAIFTRRSSAIAENEANQREARELESAFLAAAQRGSLTSAISATAGAAAAAAPPQFLTDLIQQLRTTPSLGRITITADPAVLQVKPELDISVEGGDTLYIPKRPSTIAVTGEVLNAGSFEYRNQYTVEDYIAQAGGTRETADESRIFVILPDGTARPVQQTWLTFGGSIIIPPGSVIVIPRDVAPFSFLATFTNITQITSQLALTAAALAVVAAHP